MFDRLNYSLDDFLLFSERVYQRMFELHNAAIWPLHVPAIAIGLYLVFVAIKPSSQRLRISLGLLAIVWLFVAVGFFHTRYATINWAAAYVVPAFVLMALLLAFFAVRKRPLEARPRSALPFIVGLCVLIFSLIGYPLISALPGRSLYAAEVFAIAPDPTATATLAVLAVTRGPGTLVAMMIPAMWTLATALTLYALGDKTFFVAPLAAIACLSARLAGSLDHRSTPGNPTL